MSKSQAATFLSSRLSRHSFNNFKNQILPGDSISNVGSEQRTQILNASKRLTQSKPDADEIFTPRKPLQKYEVASLISEKKSSKVRGSRGSVQDVESFYNTMNKIIKENDSKIEG